MKKLLTISFAILFLSCGTTKKVYFKSDTFKSKGSLENFEIIIPRDYANLSSSSQNYILKKWSYTDDSFIYISFDVSFADSPNKENWMKCSDAEKGIKCTDGIDFNGKHWKEIVSNDLVIGYKNVPNERKEEFDKALLSLKKQ
ncbi:MAG: hypothetical protein ABI549_08650 [Flavobacterium sp.]|uniref:hypothetical protein n=1 Tax=Flavobacterium sp. TaxID=239 RepID=UPI003262E803